MPEHEELARPRYLLGTLLGFCLWATPVLGQETRSSPELVIQLGHTETIRCAAISRDGRFVYTGSDDQNVIVWDAATGLELRRFKGHPKSVHSLTVTPEGKILSASSSGIVLWDPSTARVLLRMPFTTYFGDGANASQVTAGSVAIWETATGKPLHGSALPTMGTRIAFAPDGSWVGTFGGVNFTPEGKVGVTLENDTSVVIRQTSTKKTLHTLSKHKDRVSALAAAPDNRRLASADASGAVILWDAVKGKEIRTLTHGSPVLTLAFSPDGRRIATGRSEKGAMVWDTETGKVLHWLQDHAGAVQAVSFSADGRTLLTAGSDRTARLWDVETGNVVQTFQGSALAARSAIGAVRFLADGPTLRAVSLDGRISDWNVSDPGSGPRSIASQGGIKGSRAPVALTADGKVIASVVGKKEYAVLIDVASGKISRSFSAGKDALPKFAISADARWFAIATLGQQVKVWDTRPTDPRHHVRKLTGTIQAVALSEDGRLVAAAASKGKTSLHIWERETGRPILDLTSAPLAIQELRFSPSGRALVAFGNVSLAETRARVYSCDDGKELASFAAPAIAGPEAVAFSSSEKKILLGGMDGSLRLLDLETGTQETSRRLPGGGVTAVALSSDQHWALAGTGDGVVRLWELLGKGKKEAKKATKKESNKPACTLFDLRYEGWACVDAFGRYDSSNAGRARHLHWVLGDEPIELTQLKGRYYEPGLLSAIMNKRRKSLRDVTEFEAPRLFPALAISDARDDARFAIDLTNRGGGIGRVVVKINGKELTADARGAQHDPEAAAFKIDLDLRRDPRLRPGEPNEVEVFAFNGEGYLASRGIKRVFTPSGKPPGEPPVLWAIVVGVSKYANPALDLRYAAKDAEDFAGALRLGGGNFFEGRVRLTLLSSQQTRAEAQPTRANLERALGAAAQATSNDVLVIYLAGHGVSLGGVDGDFHFLTADARSTELGDPALRRQVTLSSQELTELIKKVPTRRQVLILDTCAAGKAVERLTEKRDLPASQVRAIERVMDRTGLHILAGCAADAVSYEATRYAQGVLTHSLLLGMSGAALRDEEFWDVGRLFAFAADKVPDLARDIGGVQRPLIASPGGAPFDIGKVTSKDRARVPVQIVRPWVPRVNFQDEDAFDDVLGLSKRVDDHLRAVSARGKDAPFVFVEAREVPNAYRLSGRYTVKSGTVSLTLKVFHDTETIATLVVRGPAAKLDALAGRVVTDFEREVRKREAAAPKKQR